MTRIFKTLAIATLMLAMLTAGWFIAQRQQPSAPTAPALITGTRLHHSVPMQAFQLKSQQQTFTGKQLQGTWHVLFFGFTQCPMMCPTTLARMHEVMAALTRQNVPLPTLWFVSLDPAHDTPTITDAYAKGFDPRFVGLSAKAGVADALARTLNVAYGEITTTDASGKQHRTLNHSGHLTVVNPRGEVVAFLTHPDEAENIAQDLKNLMQKP